ncbi:acyl carrier protein [Amycolatopsis mediterranei S699]|uniref:Acyl carrier protein n=2 Tax=Amycolatopsis mediterranei TaxID=33910 RepID=A0A0H3D426_AMYMU|nr:phosphopantetheine-binding protein [Amycolatopsis mediterranei]ADJ45411.1 acyl carrier protein [Amycolatopsis mediterranei U32]AEK42176.1 acyl carrier protein [Amycolatopsis mediterranei S699]AFO77123.1 acyl carrier protein [Amycolatopsis mediterranei S699]AGT84251.1 acyl carrier protein [Amycolatopsis mediterranei RB]KDO05990.1 acyl carrier protein [Amycolatopsis mediterranei]
MEHVKIVSAIEQALTDVLQRPVSGMAEETRLFDDLHLDSTSVLELLMALEDTVGIEVDPESLEVSDFKTIGTLAGYVSDNLDRVS